MLQNIYILENFSTTVWFLCTCNKLSCYTFVGFPVSEVIYVLLHNFTGNRPNIPVNTNTEKLSKWTADLSSGIVPSQNKSKTQIRSQQYFIQMKFQRCLTHLNCFYNGSSRLTMNQSKDRWAETSDFVMPFQLYNATQSIQNKQVPIAIEYFM